MQEADAEIVLQRAREKFPQAKPRVISDQGSQFVARDFKEFIPPLADLACPRARTGRVWNGLR
jgi:transposase InsO family protein